MNQHGSPFSLFLFLTTPGSQGNTRRIVGVSLELSSQLQQRIFNFTEVHFFSSPKLINPSLSHRHRSHKITKWSSLTVETKHFLCTLVSPGLLVFLVDHWDKAVMLQTPAGFCWFCVVFLEDEHFVNLPDQSTKISPESVSSWSCLPSFIFSAIRCPLVGGQTGPSSVGGTITPLVVVSPCRSEKKERKKTPLLS